MPKTLFDHGSAPHRNPFLVCWKDVLLSKKDAWVISDCSSTLRTSCYSGGNSRKRIEEHTSQVRCKGVERGLSGGLGLHEEAEHCQHGKASILDLLQFQLLTVQTQELTIKACQYI